MAVIADRFSRRLIIVLGLIGVSLTGIGVSCTRDFWQMIPIFYCHGIVGRNIPCSQRHPSSLTIVPANKRGRALGLHLTGGSASFLLTPAMALGIAYLFQTWRASFSYIGPSRSPGWNSLMAYYGRNQWRCGSIDGDFGES